MLEFELLLTYSITYVSLLVTIFSLLTLLEGKKIKKGGEEVFFSISCVLAV